ncbi:MAG: hypothetical protein JW955_19510, partial [Sedimentisphaerales bacterium]|nr:hypothetical protein [Sedimentisphaerales bacterium]
MVATIRTPPTNKVVVSFYGRCASRSWNLGGPHKSNVPTLRNKTPTTKVRLGRPDPWFCPRNTGRNLT